MGDSVAGRRSRSKNFLQKAVPPSHKGLFTAQAKAAGEGVQDYADEVLRPNSGASTTTKRRAVFAKRAKKGF